MLSYYLLEGHGYLIIDVYLEALLDNQWISIPSRV
jgi:hypothetical protein